MHRIDLCYTLYGCGVRSGKYAAMLFGVVSDDTTLFVPHHVDGLGLPEQLAMNSRRLAPMGDSRPVEGEPLAWTAGTATGRLRIRVPWAAKRLLFRRSAMAQHLDPGELAYVETVVETFLGKK